MMRQTADSLHDPSGFVYTDNNRVFRVILKYGEKEWQEFIKSGLFHFLQKEQYLQKTKLLSLGDCKYKEAVAFVEHEKIPCISYPYEWSFSMLRDAALFHLELLDLCLERNFITKDGSSFNIQFLGSKPIFIDLLSFIPYQKGRPWVGFSQFCQLFLFPLFLASYKSIPFQPWLRSELEGIDIYTARRFFSWLDIFKPGIFSNVFLGARLQKMFSRQKESVIKRISSTEVITKKTIQAHVRKLYKIIESLPTPHLSSMWDKYEEENTYSARDREIKHQFISEAVKSVRSSFLLDLGTNTGEYSIIAALWTKYVVAIDNDYQAIDILYRRLKEKKIKNILPLIEDVVNFSPDMGWNFKEHLSFSRRLKPDMALALALLHHVVISNNIPLKNFVQWLVALAPNLVVEFITKDDPMVKMLLKEKADTYFDYTKEAFEHYLEQYGKIIKECNLSSNSRILYFFRRKKYE